MAELSVENDSDTQALLIENDTSLKLVIGDDDCSFVEIIQSLQLHKSPDISDKVLKVAVTLDISGDMIEKWSRSIALGTYNSTLVFIELLQEFRSQHGTNATLNKFIGGLFRHGLNEEAVRLGAKFGVDVQQCPKPHVNTKCVILTCVTAVLVILVVIGAFFLIFFLTRSDNKIIPECQVTLLKRNDISRTLIDWSKIIENSNRSEIHNILSNCIFSNETGLVLSETVKTAYNGSLINFPVLIRFVREITCPWYQYTGYNALRAAMKTYGHDHTREMMTLVYFIKSILSGTVGSELSKLYTKLTESVPENIRRVIFGQCVVIRSIKFNESMYLSTVTAKSQRLVMTKIDKLQNNSKLQHLFWYFDAGFENDELFFKILSHNLRKNSSMCFTSEYFDMQRRKTAECSGDDTLNLRWVVTPVDSDVYFTIESWDGYFLYSSNITIVSGMEMRFVFTWTGASKNIVDNPQSYWDISRCPY